MDCRASADGHLKKPQTHATPLDTSPWEVRQQKRHANNSSSNLRFDPFTTMLAAALRADGYGVTTVKATGMQGEVGIVCIVVNRKNQKRAVQIIRQYNPNAFVTTQNIHYVNRPHDHGGLGEAAGSERRRARG